jgi:hypothetical protein
MNRIDHARPERVFDFRARCTQLGSIGLARRPRHGGFSGEEGEVAFGVDALVAELLYIASDLRSDRPDCEAAAAALEDLARRLTDERDVLFDDANS